MKIHVTAQPVFSKGSSTPAVARTVLQARALLEAFPFTASTKGAILEVSMSLMKHFIACEEIRERVAREVVRGRAAIDAGQVGIERNRFLQLPGVANLDSEAESFLHNAKLAVADVGRLFGPLHGKSFDHRFQKIRSWLHGLYGDEDALLLMLVGDSAWIERIINMRNVVEHPNDPAGPSVVMNFHVIRHEPLTIASPTWALGTSEPTEILEDMAGIIESILMLYEDVLVDGILRLHPQSPFTITEIPEHDRNSSMPIRLVPTLKVGQVLA